MHPNPIYRGVDASCSLAFARGRSFGMLSMNGDPAPLIAHVPFLLDREGTCADLHLVRSNPISRALSDKTHPAKLSVMGPDSYVSPDWYGVPDQVPTWNYIAVHFSGHLELRPQIELHGLLDRQSAHFEEQLVAKKPWTSDKMSDGVMDRMMRAIVPVRLHITDMQSTWKLGQNKTDAVRRAAAAHLATDGIGSGLPELSQWMDSPPTGD